jgi:Tfp pilus assembly protein PilN
MLEIINNGGIIAGAVAIILAGFRTNTARVWKDEAEAQKTRADRLIAELDEVKERLGELEAHTQGLVRLLSRIDPQKLEELTPRGR